MFLSRTYTEQVNITKDDVAWELSKFLDLLLSRKLFIYESTGARKVNQAEQQFLDQVLDRSFMDPIVQDHDFVTID